MNSWFLLARFTEIIVRTRGTLVPYSTDCITARITYYSRMNCWTFFFLFVLCLGGIVVDIWLRIGLELLKEGMNTTRLLSKLSKA